MSILFHFLFSANMPLYFVCQLRQKFGILFWNNNLNFPRSKWVFESTCNLFHKVSFRNPATTNLAFPPTFLFSTKTVAGSSLPPRLTEEV
jgi:hypothetical protein